MTDIRLDPQTNDLDLLNNTDIQLTKTSVDGLAQRLRIKLKMFINTYFMDMDFGIPYYEQVFVKGATKKLLDAIFKKAIFDTPDVSAVLSYRSQFDRANRQYLPQFTVISVDGQQEKVKVN